MPYFAMNAWRNSQKGALFMACGEPWLLLSYLPYPRPLRVRNQAIDGTRSGFSPHAASSTALVTGDHSDPSMVPDTRQPQDPNHVAGVPGTTDDAAKSSMPKSFQSTRNTRFDSPSPHAALRVSWLAPAVPPPSPSTTKTRPPSAPASLSARASPAAGGIPWPDGPVLNLRKSVFPAISGCPGRPPRC